MTQAAFTTPYSPTPYLTIQEYRDAPTAIDTSSLKVSGTQAEQDVILGTLIQRASSWADEICGQVLSATVDIEEKMDVRFNRKGSLYVHTDNWPVLELRDFQYGALPSQMVSVTDLSNVAILRHGFKVMSMASFSSSVGPIQFGPPASPNSELLVRYAYVNGYANTSVSQNATSGDTVLHVADATGIYGGPAARNASSTTPPATVLTIFDGANTEQITASAVSGTTLTLNSPLTKDHTAGVAVSALPPTVKQATVFLANALIKSRGTEALVMDEIHGSPRTIQSAEMVAYSDVAIAKEMLGPFNRAR